MVDLGEMSCDSCEIGGMTPEQAFFHASDHCGQHQHCTFTTAECAASQRVDDHSFRCCDCGSTLEEGNEEHPSSPM